VPSCVTGLLVHLCQNRSHSSYQVSHAYRWIIKSPVRNYYGDSDEAISTGLGRLAMTYQRAIGNGNPQVEAGSTGKTSHRGTYATAVPQWKVWFDSLEK